MTQAPAPEGRKLTVIIDHADEEKSARELFDAAFHHIANNMTGHRPGTHLVQSGSFTHYELLVVDASPDARRPYEHNSGFAFYRSGRRKYDW